MAPTTVTNDLPPGSPPRKTETQQTSANPTALTESSPQGKNAGRSRSGSMGARLGDLVKFLSSVKGDLANITAPPAFLAPSSVVEAGHCWAQRPACFAAPALEPDPLKRSLLVLRMVLVAMQSQFYIGGSPAQSVKKPLNAFLGELFLASWTDSNGRATGSGHQVGPPATAKLVAEQVMHHPPITAMHISDAEHGIRADGYARVAMSFSGSVDIKQYGHAVLHIDKYNEDHLIPLPDVHVKGFLGGKLYPEVLGTYSIVSSTGYISEISFTGAGFLRGNKNSFCAKMFHKADPKKKPIYEVTGVWSEGWTVKLSETGETVEKYVVDAPENKPAEVQVSPVEEQDPWESRRAWKGVLDGIQEGNYRHVVHAKTEIEQAQRVMRTEEEQRGEEWKPLFFKSEPGEHHAVFHRLVQGTDWTLHEDKTEGVWRVDLDKLNASARPFRGQLTPLG